MPIVSSLVPPFLAALPATLRPAFTSLADLQPQLQALVDNGRSAWPQLDIDAPAFIAYVGARIPDGVAAREAMAALRTADLYLACGCARGNRMALAAFDRRYIAEVELALRRMNPSAAQVDEVKQLVRQRLFVAAPGATAKIVDYSGRGDLRRWVRSVAVRIFLNHIRRENRRNQAPDDLLNGMSAGGDDPELAYIKERYRNEFQSAFSRAVDLLDDRQRVLLRYHHVDGRNIDEIGAIYRVHRVTAYRWLERARDELVQHIQKILQAELQVERGELGSILRMIRSQLHLSLVRHLGEKSSRDKADGKR